MLSKFMDILPNLIPAISAMQYKSINYEEQGISTCSFEDIKIFYIDAYEKILSFIHIPICLDNIKYRGKYDTFNFSKHFDDFMKKKKGNKLKEISKGEFFSSMINFPIDNKLRNAIGHKDYERRLTAFYSLKKIRVFVGISVFTIVLFYRTFVFFYSFFGENITQFLPNLYGTFVLTKLALVRDIFIKKNFNF